MLERFCRAFRADAARRSGPLGGVDDAAEASAAGRLPHDIASGRGTLERILGQALGEYESGWRERTMRPRFHSGVRA